MKIIARVVCFALIIVIGFASHASSAWAMCDFAPGIDGTPEEKLKALAMVKQSDNLNLRSVADPKTKKEKCQITKVLHSGGTPCPGYKGTDHVTVFILGKSPVYHVFNYKKAGSEYYCTTKL